jgi:hypothetical protein
MLLQKVARVAAIVAFAVAFVLAVLLKSNDSVSQIAGWACLGVACLIASAS